MTEEAPRAGRARLRDTLKDASAGPLILLTPFLVFVRHNDYSLIRPEMLVCIAALVILGLLLGLAMALGGSVLRVPIAAALITLVADIQSTWFDSWGLPIATAFAVSLLLAWLLRRHLCTILSIVFGVMLVTTLVVPSGTQWQLRHSEREAESDGSKPPIVHIVLDEQAGVEGIPREFDPNGQAATQLRDFYMERGFSVFGRAYSRYYDTYTSLSHLVNLDESNEALRYFEGAFRQGMSVTRNAYFEELTRRGYRIHVYQSDYMDFCHGDGAIDIASCLTYDLEKIKSIETAPLPIREKVLTIAGMYTQISFLLKELRAGLPAWGVDVGMTASVSAMGLVDLLIEQLSDIRPGSVHFVHLLLPHQPYAYRENCELRPLVGEWLRAWDASANPQRNTDATRARRYPLYLEQMSCTHLQLDRMFDAMRSAGEFERALIVIHGDHGSRLDRGPHARSTEWDLTAPDMVDAYSTLFAVKTPREAAVYDRRRLSLEQLLEHVVHRGTVRGEQAVSESGEPFVYLQLNSGVMATRGLPEFAHGSVATGIEELRRLAESTPTVANYIDLGLAYYRNRRYSDALRANTQAVRLGPENAVAYNNLCSTHVALQAFDEAIRACRRSLEIDPGFERAANNLELAQDKKRAADNELQELRRKASAEPSYQTYFNLAFAYHNRKALRESIQYYEKAIALDPDVAVTHNNACAAYNDLELWDEALSACRRALQLDPDLVRARNNLRIAKNGKRASKPDPG